MENQRAAQIDQTIAEARQDAAEGREPAVYRCGDSYLSADSGHIIGSDIGAAYLSAFISARG